ncbi:MAG: hypothetical protein OER89_09690, partial [Gemmatimonadota bacterium]|nr:hypothetical protein [Gemmatimonadota bacterium]
MLPIQATQRAVAIAIIAGIAGCGSQNDFSVVFETQHPNTSARLQAVSVVTSRVAWASGLAGTYARTLNGGASWTVGVVPGADSLQFRDVHAVSADTAYLLSAGPGELSR